MAERFWRCYGSECMEPGAAKPGFDFWSESPTCPKCRANPSKPEFRNRIVPLIVTHFLVRDPAGKIVGNDSRLRLACDANASRFPFPPAGMSTVDFSCVTCKKCKASPEWMGVLVDNRVHMDYAIELDLLNGKVNLDSVDAGKADAPRAGDEFKTAAAK